MVPAGGWWGRRAEAGGSATRAFALIDRALEEAALGRRQVERVAVGGGAGSYTGIRIAIAIAQGWTATTNAALGNCSAEVSLTRRPPKESAVGCTSLWMPAPGVLPRHLRAELCRSASVEPLMVATLSQVRSRCAAGGIPVGFDLPDGLCGGAAVSGGVHAGAPGRGPVGVCCVRS